MKLFISYTTKDNEVTINKLKNISEKLKLIGRVYVDIIDNDSPNKQERVFFELDNSNVLILISSNKVYFSEWVQKEIERANNKSIPVIEFTINEIEDSSTEKIEQKIYSNFGNRIPTPNKPVCRHEG